MSVRDRVQEYYTKFPYTSLKRDSVARNAYFEDQKRLEDKLKKDLLEELGIAGHPKADVLWRIAWDMGHASGYHEVVSVAEDLSDLLKD